MIAYLILLDSVEYSAPAVQSNSLLTTRLPCTLLHEILVALESCISSDFESCSGGPILAFIGGKTGDWP